MAKRWFEEKEEQPASFVDRHCTHMTSKQGTAWVKPGGGGGIPMSIGPIEQQDPPLEGLDP